MRDPGTQYDMESQPAPRQADIVQAGNEEVIVTAEAWSGPLPAPDDLARYEEIIPGAADRILTLAERQAAHRQMLEQTEVVGDSRRGNWGLAAGFSLSAMVIGVGTFLIATGHDWAGGMVIAIDLVGLAAVFVYGSRNG